jgi:diamine N-acetyltransferase
MLSKRTGLVDTSVRLRPTTSTDLDFVSALERHPDQQPFIGQWTREEHLSAIERSDREHWIIESAASRGLLGYLITYDVRAAGYGVYVKRIAVSDKARGVGRRALYAVADHAFRDMQAASVCLAVRRFNERAQRSYRALGFVELPMTSAARCDMTTAVDPFSDECLVMQLRPEALRVP